VSACFATRKDCQGVTAVDNGMIKNRFLAIHFKFKLEILG